MNLEALEFVVGRQMRIAIIQMHDESDRHQIVAPVIDERSAAGVAIERPSLCMNDKAASMLVRRNLPQLLEADSIFLRIDIGAQAEARHQHFGQRSAAALGE